MAVETAVGASSDPLELFHVRQLLEFGREMSRAALAAIEQVMRSHPERHDANPHARRLIETHAGADSPRAAEARARARAAVARAEAGGAVDAIDYLRKKSEDDRRKLAARGMGR